MEDPASMPKTATQLRCGEYDAELIGAALHAVVTTEPERDFEENLSAAVAAMMSRDGAGERLRQAREQAGYKRARDLVLSHGFNERVYYMHEAGSRPISRNYAAKYGDALSVNPIWLLFGDASQGIRSCPIVGIISGNGAVDLFADNEVRLERTPGLEEDMEILEVRGSDNAPTFHDRDLVFFPPLVEFVPADCDGEFCVVQLSSGVRMVRMVMMRANGRPTLLAHNLPTAIDADIVAASPIVWVRKSAYSRRRAKVPGLTQAPHHGAASAA